MRCISSKYVVSAWQCHNLDHFRSLYINISISYSFNDRTNKLVQRSFVKTTYFQKNQLRKYVCLWQTLLSWCDWIFMHEFEMTEIKYFPLKFYTSRVYALNIIKISKAFCGKKQRKLIRIALFNVTSGLNLNIQNQRKVF